MKDEYSCTQTVDCDLCCNLEFFGEDYLERNGVKGIGMLMNELRQLRKIVDDVNIQLDTVNQTNDYPANKIRILLEEINEYEKVVAAVQHVCEWSTPKDAHYVYTMLTEALAKFEGDEDE